MEEGKIGKGRKEEKWGGEEGKSREIRILGIRDFPESREFPGFPENLEILKSRGNLDISRDSRDF